VVKNHSFLPTFLSALAAFSLAARLATILGHNVWSGGALPVVVWMIVAKGLPLLFALILLLPIYSAQQLPLATLRQDASLPLGYGILLTDKT
jgi:hypothetical protein